MDTLILDNIIKVYPESAVIMEMAKMVWGGSTTHEKINFPVSNKLKVELQQLLGKDIQNIFITDSDVRHIKKKHGQSEAKRGQIDITPADFIFIPFVLNEFDTVEHTETDVKGNKKLLFTKKINGTIYTISIERGNNQIGVITLWKNARTGA